MVFEPLNFVQVKKTVIIAHSVLRKFDNRDVYMNSHTNILHALIEHYCEVLGRPPDGGLWVHTLRKAAVITVSYDGTSPTVYLPN